MASRWGGAGMRGSCLWGQMRLLHQHKGTRCCSRKNRSLTTPPKQAQPSRLSPGWMAAGPGGPFCTNDKERPLAFSLKSETMRETDRRREREKAQREAKTRRQVP